MTYGWAILVVLVAISALAYFGALSPGRFLPASCTITPGISCEDFVVAEDATSITLTLRNGMGDDLDAVTVTITDPDGGTAVCTSSLTCTDGCTDTDTMPDGILTTWGATDCTGIGATGSKFKGDVVFGYTGAGGLDHTKTGSITTQVE